MMTPEIREIIVQALTAVLLLMLSAATGWIAKKNRSKSTGNAIWGIIQGVIEETIEATVMEKAKYQGKLPDDVKRYLLNNTVWEAKKELLRQDIAPPPDDRLTEMIEGRYQTIKRGLK